MTTPSTPQTTPSLELRVPAAIVRFWIRDTAIQPDALLGRADELLLASTGVHRIESRIFAVTPESSDPAPFDTALYLSRRVLTGGRASESGGEHCSVLISPGEVLLRDGRPELLADLHAEDFAQKPPVLEPRSVHLTAWAANMLELSYERRSAKSYQGASGRVLPFEWIGRTSFSGGEPWRNPELLRRHLRTVERPQPAAELREVLTAPAARVVGPLGCGKTRLVWEALNSPEEVTLWLRAQPPRRAGMHLAYQIALQLLTGRGSHQSLGEPPGHRPALAAHLETVLPDDLSEEASLEDAPLRAVLSAVEHLATETGRPVRLICDDDEQLTARDLAFVTRLLEDSRLGHCFRLIFVGRSGLPAPSPLDGLPTFEVPPFDQREMEEFARQLFAGLSVPRPVQERLLEATLGYPFALEEGMIALAREKRLRRVYGSFFFSGGQAEGYRPSLRLACHLRAEAGRLGALLPLYLLTLSPSGAPAREVGAAASIVDPALDTDWAATGLDSGLLRREESPWGQGVRLSCPAYAAALERTIPEETGQRLSRLLGEILASRARTGEGHWESYRMLRGSAIAHFPLLRTTDTSWAAGLPRDELMAALAEEARRHRERGGDAEIELTLLLRLFPLARRAGKLRDLSAELSRGVEISKSRPGVHLALAGLKAELEQEAGEYREAENTIQRALKAAKDAGQRRQALLMIRLGRLFLTQERFREAGELFTNLGRALEAGGHIAMAATCQYFLGNIAFHERRLEDAHRFHQVAFETRRQQGLQRPTGSSLTALGSVFMALGDYPQALDCFQRARTILESHGRDEDVAFTLLGVGRALSRLGDYTAASKPLRRALELRTGKDDVAGEAVARLAVAGNYLDLGKPDEALEETRRAHFHLSLLSLHGHLADAEQILGRIFIIQRRPADAREHLESALDAHRRHGDLAAAGSDLALLLQIDLEEDLLEPAQSHTATLRDIVSRLHQSERSEQLDFHLYEGLEYLRRKGYKVGNPSAYMERSYREILRKASHLAPERRHQFLFQLAENRRILEAATHVGLVVEDPGADDAVGAWRRDQSLPEPPR